MRPPPYPSVHLQAVSTATPAHSLDSASTLEALRLLFPEEEAGFLESLVRGSGIDVRHFVPRVEEIVDAPDFESRNRRYAPAALELAERASLLALERAGIEPGAVDVLIDVSCTGILIPALDVTLAPLLGLRSNVRRIPITESGCGGGALALGLAGSLASTGQTVLVVAVELCSLTLSHQHRTRADLISAVIFGDGAGAAVLVPEGSGPRMLASSSRLIANTSAAMGFEVSGDGLRIRLERSLPSQLAACLGAEVDAFLAEHERTRADVGLHLVHPGGRRILEGYASIFDLPRSALTCSFEALRRHGNLSSAAVFSVLELAQAREHGPHSGEALLVGVGPGLSLELALFEWAPGVEALP